MSVLWRILAEKMDERKIREAILVVKNLVACFQLVERGRRKSLAKKPGSQAAAHTLGTNGYQRSKCQDEAWSDDDMMMLVAAR